MSHTTYAAPRSISRRGFLATTAAAGAALALPQGAFAQAEGQLLLWLPGGSDLFCKIHTGLLEGFSAGAGLGPATTVCGLGQDTEFTQALIGSITAGAPPDISMLWDSPVSLGAQGAFMALDDMMKGSKIDISTWPSGLLSSCQFKGATYGLPVTAGVYAMWYNEEMLEAKGIPSDRASFPKTWVEMRKLSKEFTVWDGDNLKSAGFMPNRIPETMAIWSALNGGMLFDEANLKYMLDSEQNVEMMSFFLEWLDEEYKGDVNLIDRSGNFREGYADGNTGVGPAFREGRQAGLMSGSWLMGDIYADPAPTFTRWNSGAEPGRPVGHQPGVGDLAELVRHSDRVEEPAGGIRLSELSVDRRIGRVVSADPRRADQRSGRRQAAAKPDRTPRTGVCRGSDGVPGDAGGDCHADVELAGAKLWQ